MNGTFLSGKVAVVTGAETQTGCAISELFAAEGARVVVNYGRSKQDADGTIQSMSRTAVALQADVSGQANALMESAVSHFGRLDYLINNAGWSAAAPAQKTTRVGDREHCFGCGAGR